MIHTQTNLQQKKNKTKQKNLLEIGMIFEEHLLFF